MRDILFRGIGIKSREWVYGAYVPAMDEDDCDSIIDEQGEHHIVFSDTVGQYTGLKDKDGKVIWEGDIVEWENLMKKTMRSVIRYIYNGFKFTDFDGEDQEIWCYVFEAIGNIHDNPDLLK